MTLKFIDLYNKAASQEWSMYDNDAEKTEEFEKSLVVDLNKALTEILYSQEFPFRERTHIVLTIPNINSYEIPAGLISKTSAGTFGVKINSKNLKYISDSSTLDNKKGVPEYFYLKGNKIHFYPAPDEKLIVTIDYLTLSIGEDKNGNEIYSLTNEDDTISVPAYLEEIFSNAVISRTMLNSIASESDENYSAYKKQSEIAYRMLVKYSNGIEKEKSIKM